jgi:MerR family transcriptional regulator, repressor of the yfmOP operon
LSATATGERLRIGELAELTGTTARTIRYYEEIGLLPGPAREQGRHRTYSQADVERVREILRLKELLGLSLEQLSTLLEAEAARAEIRRELEVSTDPKTLRRLLGEALGHIDTQLELVHARQQELEKLEEELSDRRRRAQRRLRELGA